MSATVIWICFVLSTEKLCLYVCIDKNYIYMFVWLKRKLVDEMVTVMTLVLNIQFIYEIYLDPDLSHKILSNGANIVFKLSSVTSNGGDT